MQNLNAQAKDFSFVINESRSNPNFSIENLIKKIRCWVKERKCLEYYFILHDKDVNEDGELKTRHIHLLYNVEHRVRFKTELNSLCAFLFEDSKYVSLISIEKWRYHDEGIQYLCHKNNPEKKPYPVENVFTNDKNYLEDIMKREIEVTLRMEDIMRICWDSETVVDVYLRVGLKNAKLYCHVIDNCFRHVTAEKKKERLEKLYDDCVKEGELLSSKD